MNRLTIYRVLLKTPGLEKLRVSLYKKLGVTIEGKSKLSQFTIYGKESYLHLHNNCEINYGCFILAKDKITIGENSTLAYNVSILTSANPNGPHNLLSKIYPAKTAPVTIKDNVWVGANSVILPGVTIGSCCVIAAGAVVNRDVPDNTMVGGVPAKFIKKIVL